MSVPVPAPQQGSSRALWIGVGAGCGCLTLLAAIVVVILVLGAVFRTTAPQPVAQPQRGQPAQPAAPPPPQPQGGGAPAGQAGELQINVVMAKLDQNHNPVQQTNAFQVGDVVGAVAQMVSVPGNITAAAVWLKVDGDNATPLANPRPFQLTPDAQGKTTVFFLSGAPAGTFMFIIALPGQGDEMHVVATAKFTIQ